MLLSKPNALTPANAPNTPNGTVSKIATGVVQLSYCAANTRNTIRNATANAIAAWLPASSSW